MTHKKGASQFFYCVSNTFLLQNPVIQKSKLRNGASNHNKQNLTNIMIHENGDHF